MKRESDIIISPALAQALSTAWEQCRILLFSAACGFGKTAVAGEFLRGRTVYAVSALDEPSFTAPLPAGCIAVLVDDLQYLLAPAEQQALCELIRSRPDLHFVLLTRGQTPGWLMPFELSGLLRTIDASQMHLDRSAARQLLEAGGVQVSPGELTEILNQTQGYAAALRLLCLEMQNGAPYSKAVMESATRRLFAYYEENVFHRFAPPLRELLLDLAPFEPFHAELAKMVSGDADAGHLLGQILRDTNMLQYDGLDTYHFWPIFRDFLLWEQQKMPLGEQRALMSRAALYYELHEDVGRALDCYARAGEHHKVSALLEKNAELHPGVGHYYEMEEYYFALPKEEILRSPSLMCGMSMLTSMCMDWETSEQWYAELQAYAARLKKSDNEYRAVQGKLAYLDIALPQRGSSDLLEVIGSVFRVLTNKQIKLPAFSVTSTLPSVMNGGKDFCEWSKRDDLLYATMRGPLETVLGRDGVGLADCAICESKFEQGADISGRMLALMGRLGEIQSRGTPDIEFAVVGLWARMQTAQGKAAAALEVLESLRTKFTGSGELRFLPNLDALCCRLQLRLGNRDAALHWLAERAPKDEARLRALWRYQYLTRAMVQICQDSCDDALLVLARLLPYCERCGRTMDVIYLRILMSICHFHLRDQSWKAELHAALDSCCLHRFIMPVAQFGAAVLPLLSACGWQKDEAYFARLMAAVRLQAVNYPEFLQRPCVLTEALSAAELQVLKLLCHNKSNAEIGEILGIKVSTVKTHVHHILAKLGVSRRSEANAAARELHLI